MRTAITRREALKGMGLAGLGLLAGRGAAAPKDGAHGKWWRGNLHMHTYWSDGRVFPEQAVDIYKNRLGYDFLALSEHNIFAGSGDHWKPVLEKEGKWPPDVTKPYFDTYMASAFGKEAQTRAAADGKTEVRLRSYDEVKKMFEEPGKFLLMPGVEITQVTDGINVHVNYVNLPDVVPCVKGGPLSRSMKGVHPTELLRQNAREVAALAAAQKRPAMLMLNHPQWVYLDIKAENLIENPEVRFFEVCNGGSAFAPPAEAPLKTNDPFWDAVNAFRSLKGAPLIFGTGSDDTHYYFDLGDKKAGRVGVDYTVVRSAALAPDALLAAMHAGDFYTSTGVTLDDIAFDAAKRALHVKVRPAPGASYKIRFIATKKGFDQTVRTVEVPAVKGHGARTVPIYSPEIGKTVKLAEGTEAAYAMAADDLYVRAKIESSVPSAFKGHFHPDVQVAWTQPYPAV
jgi:histidinol phosphatase-like PHP family hydrolase